MVFETSLSLFWVLIPNASVLLSIAIIGLFLFYKSYKFDVWEKQGVQGPKPIPIFGNSHESFFTSFVTLHIQRREKYGKIYGLYEQSAPILNVAEPELLRYIMVKDSDVFINRRHDPVTEPLLKNMLNHLRGGKWKRTRSIMSPTFTTSKIKKMAPLINSCVKGLLANIESKVKNNEDVDVKAFFSAFALDSIAYCAMSTKTANNLNDPFLVNALRFVELKKWRLFMFLILPGFISKALNFNVVPSFVASFFRDSTKEIIKQRKECNVKHDDFLQLLLDAEKSTNLMQAMKDINAEQLNNENQEELEKNAKLLTVADVNSKLTEAEIQSQCLAILIAGFETTSLLMMYATYSLATNSECQRKLYEEVKHYYDIDKEFTLETTNKMKYLNAFINETLRLYPSLVKVDREAGKDYKLPNTDITVPKGAHVHIPIYTVHHDPDNYAEPYSFKPERFLPENIGDIKPYTFIPFGSGPRNCIGMRFALMEAKLALCNVVLNYKFFKSPNTDVPLKFVKRTLSVLGAERVIVRCEKRN